MICWNNEQNAWDFKGATDEEKQKLLELGERYWANTMAAALAARWIEQESEEVMKALSPPVSEFVQ
jgi:hypothetical protein